MEKIRWGIIGCGDVTEVKSGPALQQAVGSELVAVMRRNAGQAEDYARRHGVARWYGDADSLMNDPDVTAVYVATPPGSHCEYALRVCSIGKPAYVEKPMARNNSECVRMMTAFRERGQKLFVAYYRRALPRFLKAKEVIDSGSLGMLSGVYYRYEDPQRHEDPAVLPWRYRAEDAGGGLFFDLGSHALDILDFLLGPLQDVAGIASNRTSANDVEDNVVMHWRWVSGILGTASWNFCGCEHQDRLEIVGTQGRIRLSVFGDEPVQVRTGSKVETFDLPNPRHIQQPLIQTIVDDLLGRGTCPSTGASAARTARVMDLVTASYYGSRDVDFWNAPQQWPGRKLTD
ncbi:MAG: Gfo/Idh/MocA family oxidoreductase [Planctomycetaceae bacterium]|jgi:predicted dehydrogenase